MGYDNNNNNDGPLINITGLWRSRDGQGLNGRLGGARIIIYKNRFKKEDKHPDYMLAVVNGYNNNRGGGGHNNNRGGGGHNNNRGGGGHNQGNNAPPPQQGIFDGQPQGGGDDIPF